MLKRLGFIVATTVAGLALVVAPASAIIGGTQDTGNTFSNVGLVVMDGHHFCSGALYRTNHSATSSTMFMTAAHCLIGFNGTFKVTFDPAGDTNPNAQYINVVAKYAIPSFAESNNNNSLQNGNGNPDVGVLVLDHAPAGITPDDLPSAGLIDTLNLKTAVDSVVGYGINDFSNANTFSIGPRYYKNAGFIPGQRTQTSAIYAKTAASTCSGDSGGPNFLSGTNITMGVTSWGQSLVCSDHNYFYRVDNAEALSFLANPAATGVTN